VEAKALVDTLDETLPVTDVETLGDTVGDVETFALVDTLALTLAEAEANTVNNTLLDVKAEALIDKLAVTLLDEKLDDNLPEGEAERQWDIWAM